METAAAAIANMIAYNVAVARAASEAQQTETTSDAPKPEGGFRAMARNWDLITVTVMIGSLAGYAPSQFRI